MILMILSEAFDCYLKLCEECEKRKSLSRSGIGIKHDDSIDMEKLGMEAESIEFHNDEDEFDENDNVSGDCINGLNFIASAVSEASDGYILLFSTLIF